jgi:hypothetical protein
MERPADTEVFYLSLRREGARIAFSLTDRDGEAPWFCTQDFPREANNVAPFVWTHLVGVWDGCEIRLYLNGRPHGKPQPFEGPLRKNTAALYIGEPPKHGRFRGVIDNVSLYRRVLSAEEVRGRFLRDRAGIG